jgi:asparagine synthase (glutamine-hydrolysing)
MPGIVGLITKKPKDWANERLRRMVNCLCHEPFYKSGTWSDAHCGVYVGWVAQANSFSDGMPLSSNDKDITLVFSGEDFSNDEALQRLNNGGRAPESGKESYLVRAYDEQPSFPKCLNGRFHGLVADRKRGSTILFNDRYGIGRLYYYQSEDGFYFACEAKAILAVCPELRSLNHRSLGEYISCGCVLQNRTLFEGLNILPPGSAWAFRDGVLQKDTYFKPEEWESQEQIEPEQYYEALREVFVRTLPNYFSSATPVGLSLTGGLDTRMILAWHKSPPNSLPCYTFGSMFRDCQDVVIARRVARACEQPHQVIPLEEAFLSRFGHYAERAVYLTDGCCNVSHSPDLYVNEIARSISPVRMTGNYGGEILRQVRAFKPVRPAAGLFSDDILPFINQARETYDTFQLDHPLSFAAFRQSPWHHYGLLSLEQTQLSLRSPYLDNELVKTVYRAPASAVRNDEVCKRLIAEGSPALSRIRTDRAVDWEPPSLLGSAHRSYRTFTIKAEYAYDYGMPQWLARTDSLFRPLHIERNFLGRNKFYHFRLWYRDYLADYVRGVLLDTKALSRSYLLKGRLETMVEGHLSGSSNYTSEIHTLLTLELVQRLFLDSVAGPQNLTERIPELVNNCANVD